MDPLFHYQENTRIVSDVREFQDQIQQGKKVSDELKGHCKDIYSKIDIKVLENLE